MAKIIVERLAQLPSIPLLSGAHSSAEEGFCAMELASWIVGEPWSDHPKCACPVISAFMRTWNDDLSDDERTKILLPVVPRLVGTRGSKALEARRATMAADWYVRVATPAWLRLAGLDKHADTLAAFPEITSFEKTPSIRPALEAAQKDAEAAWSAARSAAWSAAESAAESAAWSAARSAAESAARSAAWSAAWSAAESAARSAADEALAPTVKKLQASAIELVERMAAVGR